MLAIVIYFDIFSFFFVFFALEWSQFGHKYIIGRDLVIVNCFNLNNLDE